MKSVCVYLINVILNVIMVSLLFLGLEAVSRYSFNNECPHCCAIDKS